MNKAIFYWKTLVCSVLMLILFLVPTNNISRVPSVPGISELIHVFMFALFTWFFLRDRVRIGGLIRPSLNNYIVAILLSFLFGITIELLQKFSGFGRSAEYLDVVYDVSGSLLAAGIIMVYYRIKPVD